MFFFHVLLKFDTKPQNFYFIYINIKLRDQYKRNREKNAFENRKYFAFKATFER